MSGDELKQWRQDRDLLQEVLAEQLGVHVMTISKWERGAQAVPPFLHLALETIERNGKKRKPVPGPAAGVNGKPRKPAKAKRKAATK